MTPVDEHEEGIGEELSFTPTELATVLVVGVAVACTAYCLGRVRRGWNRIDPTSEFRHRIRDARATYKDEHDAWMAIGLFAPTAKRFRGVSTAYSASNREFGEAVRAFGHLRENIRSMGDAR